MPPTTAALHETPRATEAIPIRTLLRNGRSTRRAHDVSAADRDRPGAERVSIGRRSLGLGIAIPRNGGLRDIDQVVGNVGDDTFLGDGGDNAVIDTFEDEGNACGWGRDPLNCFSGFEGRWTRPRLRSSDSGSTSEEPAKLTTSAQMASGCAVGGLLGSPIGAARTRPRHLRPRPQRHPPSVSRADPAPSRRSGERRRAAMRSGARCGGRPAATGPDRRPARRPSPHDPAELSVLRSAMAERSSGRERRRREATITRQGRAGGEAGSRRPLTRYAHILAAKGNHAPDRRLLARGVRRASRECSRARSRAPRSAAGSAVPRAFAEGRRAGGARPRPTDRAAGVPGARRWAESGNHTCGAGRAC